MISFKNSLYTGLLLLGLGMLPVSAMNIKPAISDQAIVEFNRKLFLAILKESFQDTQDVVNAAFDAGATSDQFLKILTERHLSTNTDPDRYLVALLESTPEITIFLLEIATIKLSSEQFFKFISTRDYWRKSALSDLRWETKTQCLLDEATKKLTQKQFSSFITKGVITIHWDEEWPITWIIELINNHPSDKFVIFFNMFLKAAQTGLSSQDLKSLVFFIPFCYDGMMPMLFDNKYPLTKEDRTILFKTIINAAAIYLNNNDFQEFLRESTFRTRAENAANQEYLEAIKSNELLKGRANRLRERTTILTNKHRFNTQKHTKRFAVNTELMKKLSNDVKRRNETQIRIDNEKFKSGDQVVSILPIFSALAQNKIQ